MTSVRNIIMLGFALPASFLWMACGGESAQKRTNCSGQVGNSCFEILKPGGGEIRWEIGQLNANEEYIVALYTPDVEQPSRLSPRSVSIEAAVSSAQPPSREQRAAEQVIARQRNNPFRNRDENLTYNNEDLNVNLPPRPAASNFYVPTPSDYSTAGENGIRQFRIRSQANPSGRAYDFESIFKANGVFELLFNQGLVANLSIEETNKKRARYLRLGECLQRTVPETLSYLGMPENLDNDPEIKILLTNLGESGNTVTLGFFSPNDRHERAGKKTLTDSNRGEFIYLQPETSKTVIPTERLCSTTPHELAHQIRYDSAVLGNLPKELWPDLNEAERRDLWGEWRALDEGYAHIVEMLTGLPQSVSSHLYDFFTNPNGASLSANDEFQSRGFATAFVLRILERKGGTLELNDTRTKEILRSLIRGKKIGLKNIGDLLGEKEEEVFADFAKQFSISLYDANAAENFLPPLSTSTSGARINRGIEIQPRSTPVENIKFTPPVIHPYQVEIPLLRTRENLSMKPQGIHFFRFIVPAKKKDDDEIIFSSETTGLYVVLTRVR